MKRPACPACIADERRESSGDALVFGMILASTEGAMKRQLCAKHGASLLAPPIAPDEPDKSTGT